MNITIYGTSCCKKCNQILKTVEGVIKEFDLDTKVKKIDDPLKAIEMGVMSLPALAVDGEIKISGKVATKEEIKEILNV